MTQTELMNKIKDIALIVHEFKSREKFHFKLEEDFRQEKWLVRFCFDGDQKKCGGSEILEEALNNIFQQYIEDLGRLAEIHTEKAKKFQTALTQFKSFKNI